MVAIITGIIIDTFSELRAQKAEVEDNQLNMCFVCSLDRDQFERKGLKFADHVEIEHNPWNYMYYKMYLERKGEKDLTANEKQILSLIRAQSIEYFPIDKAMALVQEEEEEEPETDGVLTEVSGNTFLY